MHCLRCVHADRAVGCQHRPGPHGDVHVGRHRCGNPERPRRGATGALRRRQAHRGACSPRGRRTTARFMPVVRRSIFSSSAPHHCPAVKYLPNMRRLHVAASNHSPVHARTHAPETAALVLSSLVSCCLSDLIRSNVSSRGSRVHHCTHMLAHMLRRSGCAWVRTSPLRTAIRRVRGPAATTSTAARPCCTLALTRACLGSQTRAPAPPAVYVMQPRRRDRFVSTGHFAAVPLGCAGAPGGCNTRLTSIPPG